MISCLEKRILPIDGWLSQGHMAITCRIVPGDQSPDAADADSLYDRELTGWLLSNGHIPAGRWVNEAAYAESVTHASQKFRVKT